MTLLTLGLLFLGCVAVVYGMFWWGVWCGERGIVRAWVPRFRRKEKPMSEADYQRIAGELGRAMRKHEEQLVRSVFEDGKAGDGDPRRR